MLPSKIVIENWECKAVIERLMQDHKWPKKVAKQWFTDFMRWLYCSLKWQERTPDTPFSMDGLHYLDDVWHMYILHSKEYWSMCQKLFGVPYIHHVPAPAFIKATIDKVQYKNQLVFLLEEWGEEYIDRVWAYGADVSDIAGNSSDVLLS